MLLIILLLVSVVDVYTKHIVILCYFKITNSTYSHLHDNTNNYRSKLKPS